MQGGAMNLINNRYLLISAALLIPMSSMADCDNSNTVVSIVDSNIYQTIEGDIPANTFMGSDVLQMNGISSCNDSPAEELVFTATQPNSESSPRFYNTINGSPAYYLNKDYAYTIKMDNSHAYTASGMSVTTQNKNGIVNLPRATISIYAAVKNPEPLRLSSSQIGIVKNNRFDTVAKLRLSANIDTIDNCSIETDRISFEFNDLEIIDFPKNIGKTSLQQTGSITVHCTNNSTSKNVSISLTNKTNFANTGEAVIKSTNSSIGFVLYSGQKQIKQGIDTVIGAMNNNLSFPVTAYIYKLKDDIEPGRFSGTAEYTIKFN